MSERSHATEFDFGDLTIIEIPVTGPNKKNYILREASEAEAARFDNARAECAKFKDGGMSAVVKLADSRRFLVGMCLFCTNEDGTRNPASLIAPNVLIKWPSRVVKALYNTALEISELDDDQDLDALKKERAKLDERIEKLEEDAAKNEPSGTESGLNMPQSEDMAVPSSTSSAESLAENSAPG